MSLRAGREQSSATFPLLVTCAVKVDFAGSGLPVQKVDFAGSGILTGARNTPEPLVVPQIDFSAVVFHNRFLCRCLMGFVVIC